jgi:hypothetical protein
VLVFRGELRLVGDEGDLGHLPLLTHKARLQFAQA